MAPTTNEAPRFTTALRILAWVGLSAAQIFDFLIVQAAVRAATNVWFEEAKYQLLLQDPRNATTHLVFITQLVFYVTNIVLALIMMGVMLWMEHYFKVGERKKTLRKRILKVAAVEVAIIAIAYVVITIAIQFTRVS